MELTPIERFEVIADFPYSGFKIGTIMVKDAEGIYCELNNDDHYLLVDLNEYPHIFRKL